MYAIVTGASSGIGFEISKILSDLGYYVIAVGRNKERLEILKKECKNQIVIEKVDLSYKDNCIKLIDKYIDYDIEVLVNNAGFGDIGNFCDTSLKKELDMINVNIVAPHILTKRLLNKWKTNNSKGYILNVSSTAAFAPGPLMATYYATKSYIYKLSVSVNKELKKIKSDISISVLCPGPVATQFNKRIGINASVKPDDVKNVARYGIDYMFKKKRVIIPGIKNKLGAFLGKVLPECILEKYIYNMQLKKMKK